MSASASAGPAAVEHTVEGLQVQLDIERRRNKDMAEQIRQLKRQMGLQQSQIEAEEELITNKLMVRIEEVEKEKQSLAAKVEWEERRLKQEKQSFQAKINEITAHLEKLKHEKETLAQQVEQEEEFLTNTLQKKLRKVLMEKVDLENRLEQEQEYISNKLQKQVSETQKEKKLLEKLLEEEKEKVALMEEQKRQAADQLKALKLSVECEQEYISNKLGKTVEMYQQQKDELMRKLEIEQHNVAMLSRECETQRQELRKFQGASYVMQQRIIRESQRLRDMKRAKGKLAETFELELERQLNNVMKQQLGVAIEQPPPRPHFSYDSSLPLPDNDGSDEGEGGGELGEIDGGDVVGELMRDEPGSSGPRWRRQWRTDFGETQSLPNFSPRQSPYPTPPATPFSSRSHSPINASPSSSRSQSPATNRSQGSCHSMSSADTRASTNFRGLGKGGVMSRSGGVSPSPATRGFVPVTKDPAPPKRLGSSEDKDKKLADDAGVAR